MFTIYTFLMDNEKVEEEEKLQKRWSWFKMIAIKPRREEEEEEEERKRGQKHLRGKRNRLDLK